MPLLTEKSVAINSREPQIANQQIVMNAVTRNAYVSVMSSDRPSVIHNRVHRRRPLIALLSEAIRRYSPVKKRSEANLQLENLSLHISSPSPILSATASMYIYTIDIESYSVLLLYYENPQLRGKQTQKSYTLRAKRAPVHVWMAALYGDSTSPLWRKRESQSGITLRKTNVYLWRSHSFIR